MTNAELLGIRITLGSLALGAVITQLVVVPRVAGGLAEQYPQVAHLEFPYMAALTLAIVGFEFALFSVWRLVTVAATRGAAVARVQWWANVMTASLGFTALLMAGVFVHAGSVESIGGPPMLFGLLACLAVLPVALLLRRWATRFVPATAPEPIL